MDGSQKLPQRLLGAMQNRLAKNLPIATHALAVAGWMRYVTARDEQGRAIDVRDPLAAELAGLAREPVPSPNGWRPHCSASQKCSGRSAPSRACARP